MARSSSSFRSRSQNRSFRSRIARKLVRFAIIVTLLILPGPSSFAFKQLPVLASDAVTVTTDSIRSIPVFLKWLFTRSGTKPRQETLADRIARTSDLQISPHKLAGFVGDSVTFVAMATDSTGQPVHGTKFTCASSDEKSLTIDEAGRASLLRAGLVGVTCRAGSTHKTVPVVIRPTRRPLQTDAEWRLDQDSLDPSKIGPIGFNNLLPSLVDKLAPTAHAQGNSTGDFGNAAYVGAVGTPPYAALEGTRLGPVMPGTNFELAMPLVELGGRGPSANLNLYYNSNVWGAYFDPARNSTVYNFDPIQGWPSPGVSLGFGRIVYYNLTVDGNGQQAHTYMLIDPDGTRHDLGVGTDYGTNTLKTTDGTHITFVGSAANGGTLYYNDGTAVTIGKVNNRLLPTQITDTNGNYLSLAPDNYFYAE